jgi:hypothetical protein
MAVVATAHMIWSHECSGACERDGGSGGQQREQYVDDDAQVWGRGRRFAIAPYGTPMTQQDAQRAGDLREGGEEPFAADCGTQESQSDPWRHGEEREGGDPGVGGEQACRDLVEQGWTSPRVGRLLITGESRLARTVGPARVARD